MSWLCYDSQVMADSVNLWLVSYSERSFPSRELSGISALDVLKKHNIDLVYLFNKIYLFYIYF